MNRALLAFLGFFGLSSCAETYGDVASAITPSPAVQVCLRDVASATGTPDVELLSSEASETATLVRVGVGPDRAPWQCIANGDGTTTGIESLADEGAL